MLKPGIKEYFLTVLAKGVMCWSLGDFSLIAFDGTQTIYLNSTLLWLRRSKSLKCSRAITVVGRFLVARKPALSAAMKPSDGSHESHKLTLNSQNVNKS